jgi:hypothetical protein
MPGNRELPPLPGEKLGPDIFTKYNTDPLALRALREQAQLRGEARQKQLVEASALLLQIAQDLRKQMASQPASDAVSIEKTRLEHIQKLAHMIRDREKAEDNISADLARVGVM